ncbi:MAG TPA: response regulator transcription factor [Dehalococcoidia bacterium]|nr:response regulator transcription factor [Dehalococcoidia bacterium]
MNRTPANPVIARSENSPRSAANPPIRVLIADDHAVLRQALRYMLEAQSGLEVVGEASNGREAVDMAEKLHPDVILMDTIMPGLNGIEATRQVRRRLPKTKVLMLTGYMEDEHVAGALKAGASGYVIKKSEIDELLLGIQAVHRGNPYFSSSIGDGDLTDYLWQLKSNSGRVGYELLTAREREVLQLIAEGRSNQKIADELFISVKTVEAHRAHIMTKLHAKNRTDLIRYAIRKGLVALDAVPIEDEAGA